MVRDSAQIKGRGVVLYFAGKRFYRGPDGEVRVGGQGFIHKERCKSDCRDKSHTLAKFTWVQAWRGGLEYDSVLGSVVNFTAYSPKNGEGLPSVYTMRLVDPRYGS